MLNIIKTKKMKIFNKYIPLSFIVALCTIACDNDDDDYIPGNQASGGVEVYFSKNNSSNIVMNITENELKFTLTRNETSGELTVPISSVTTTPQIFEIPQTVTFANGIDTTELVVKVTDQMVPFTSYLLSITVDEQYTNPYKANSLYPRFDINVLKEDYADVYTGTYVSEFWEEEWETSIQYSELLGLYRIKDWIIPNYTFSFSWDKETNKLTPSEDEFAIGWEYGDYGMVYAVYNSDYDYYYNPDEQVFSFTFDWAVSAGTLATATEEFHIAK